MLKTTVENFKRATNEILIIALLAFCLGLFLGLLVPNKIQKQANTVRSNTTLLVGKDGNVVTDLKGRQVLPCNKRNGEVRKEFGECRAGVEIIDGEPTLVDIESREPIPKDLIFSFATIHVWAFQGSHCTKHYILTDGTEIDLC